MKDRTDEIAQFVSRYEDLDFVPLRIQGAFDRTWWDKTGGSASFSDLGVSLSDEGASPSHLARVLGMPTQFAALLLESLSASHPDPLTALRTYLSSLPTPTAIHSSIQTLTRVLLLHTALHTGSSHLVLGTSLTSLAVSLISGVAQGGGFNVREDTMEEWTPDPERQPTQEGPQKSKKQPKRTVRVVRPLRDIGMKECAAWAWWSRIPVVGKEKWVWPGAKPGIGTLTKGAPQLVLCM